MRGIDGPCGHWVEAEDDEGLVKAIQSHATEVHPELVMTEEQIRELVTTGARDA